MIRTNFHSSTPKVNSNVKNSSEKNTKGREYRLTIITTIVSLSILISFHFVLNSFLHVDNEKVETEIISNQVVVSEISKIDGDKGLITNLGNVSITPRTKTIKMSSIIISRPETATCSSSVKEKYGLSSEDDQQRDLEWCQTAIRMNGVIIGHTWGTLSKADTFKWDKINCNELINVVRRRIYL